MAVSASPGSAVRPPHVDVDGVLRVRRNLDPLGLPRRSSEASLPLDLGVPPRDALQRQRDSQDWEPFNGLENDARDDFRRKILSLSSENAQKM